MTVGIPTGGRGRGLCPTATHCPASHPTTTCSSYIPEPKCFLHAASAEAKQLWTVASLLLMARAAAPVRLAIVALLVGASMAALPCRLWRPQLARLGGLCALIFVFTLIGGWLGGAGS